MFMPIIAEKDIKPFRKTKGQYKPDPRMYSWMNAIDSKVIAQYGIIEFTGKEVSMGKMEENKKKAKTGAKTVDKKTLAGVNDYL